jgi:uncharacterized membrane protein YagU involved in acid resistance
MQGRNFFTAILLGGLVAGTIDIGAAALINLISPVIIAQAIASGLLGKASYFDGWQTAALGVALQWLMSLIIAAIFVVAATRMEFLRRRWITAGLAYGVVVFVVMNYVVVPLSNAYPKHTHPMPPDKILENLLAMLLFGLIVSYFARNAVR